MTSITYSSVRIQTSAQSVPAIPSWFGEVTLIVHYLGRQNVLSQIEKQVHFARRRFGHSDVIDFVAVRLRYAISGERTLEAFYQRVSPFASTFMALFGRDRLPARSTLSRFLAALTPEPVEALRALFLSDLLARPLLKEGQPGRLWDREATRWVVFDIDGTREAASPRGLPVSPDRPARKPPHAGSLRCRLDRPQTWGGRPHPYNGGADAHAPVACHRSRNSGNRHSRQELRCVVAAIQSYVQAQNFPEHHTLIQMSGQYGTGAVLADLAGLAYLRRGKDSRLLDPPEVQARLHLPADQQLRHPESGICRALYDCPDQSLGKTGKRVRIIVATHRAGTTKSRVGVTRSGVVSELAPSQSPPERLHRGFCRDPRASHRGAWETALADEDLEQDPDRWGSQAASCSRMVADHQPMGLERAPGTGPSA